MREPIQVVVVRELFCEAKPSDEQRSEGPTGGERQRCHNPAGAQVWFFVRRWSVCRVT